ncbi:MULTISPECIES: DUF4255 domain-containing protein [Chryseobacterium]|uniref:DUF4255 domain-containing protein n=1 Tax=Chryseobacterium viscerum TaxID=1037377 RepID=A0A5N4BRA5_9FLAO|nr:MULTISPECIES: DUF4255 domain-containing protein [Chryseobacterium]KAB1230962.1 DUF4255 domain-containing protein [Chryseobacterium viscerum]UKB81160.1 DUF4255 domain-containing protein [Chryseobacterium sp. MEBOG07]
MIDNVLTVLKDQLNSSADLRDIVVVDDIAKHDDDTSGLENKVVITLLNVEEESTLKNRSRYTKKKISDNPTRYDMQQENAPAYLNLYVMISANRTRYSNALINISKVIEVFQTNNVLSYIDPETTKDVDFRIELHSIPFDQLSYIWGLLGGKIMPSALYKISVVKIVAKGTSTIELINDVNIKGIKVN